MLNKTLHVSNSSSVRHQEFFTVHTAKLYFVHSCWQLASRIRTEVPARKLSTNLYDNIPLLCVQWKTSDDGQRNCPKHVEFYSKNKFEKLVHLVGFIVRTCETVFDESTYQTGDVNVYVIAHQSVHVNRKCSLHVVYVWLQPRGRKSKAQGRRMNHR